MGGSMLAEKAKNESLSLINGCTTSKLSKTVPRNGSNNSGTTVQGRIMQTTTVQGRRIKTVLTCFDCIADLVENRLRTKVSSARLRLATYARPLPKSHPSLLKKSWLKNLLAWISASQELVEEASCIGAATGCDAGLCNVCDASLHGGPHELAEALTDTTVRSLQTLICIPPASIAAPRTPHMPVRA